MRVLYVQAFFLAMKDFLGSTGRKRHTIKGDNYTFE